MKKQYHVIIEQDEDGVYVGKVPELRGCVSQGDTIDELITNIKEAILLCLEVRTKKGREPETRFVGVQQVDVA
jgi:predicted RNase H-like HicB family nuclease